MALCHDLLNSAICELVGQLQDDGDLLFKLEHLSGAALDFFSLVCGELVLPPAGQLLVKEPEVLLLGSCDFLDAVDSKIVKDVWLRFGWEECLIVFLRRREHAVNVVRDEWKLRERLPLWLLFRHVLFSWLFLQV